MNFDFSDVIPAARDDVARILLDPDYQNSLSGLGPLSERRVLAQEPLDDGRVRRRVRCVLEMDLSGAVRKFLGNADPTWVEEAVWYPERGTWEWRIVPEVGGDLLRSNGVITLTGVGGETRRDVTGAVQVRVPFYGGKVEGMIIDGLRRTYTEEAARLAAWAGR